MGTRALGLQDRLRFEGITATNFRSYASLRELFLLLRLQCDNEREFSAVRLVTGKLRNRMGRDNMSLLVYLMKNVDQLEEWDHLKTNIIRSNVVLGEWHPTSDVMSDEAYVDSYDYDLALMKSPMWDTVDLTPNELKAMSSDDEDIGDSNSTFEDDADVECDDEDDL